MASNDLATASKNWAKRIAFARAAGMPDSSWQRLAQQDIQNVMAGHSPTTDAIVYDQMFAAGGRSPIKDPSNATSSPLDILGNIPSDIRGIVTGFPAGVAQYASTLPEQAQSLQRLINPATHNEEAAKLGMETGSNITDIGGLLRNMAKVPVLSPLVPGVTTAAEATTPQGRETIAEHPVSTVLDVGGAISEAGKLGTFGSEAASTEADITAKTAAGEKLTPEEQAIQAKPKTLSALQSGNPYKATGRAALNILESTPKIGKRVNRAVIRQTLQDMAVHPKWIDTLMKPKAELEAQMGQELADFVSDNIVPAFQSLTEDERNLLIKGVEESWTDAEKQTFNANPKLVALKSDVARLKSEIEKADPNVTRVKRGGRSYSYATKSEVAQSFKKHEQLARTAKKLETASADLETRARDAIQKYGPGDPLAQKAVARHVEMQKRYEAADREVGKQLRDFHQKMDANAAPAYYPMLARAFREGATNIAKAKFANNAVRLKEALDTIEGSVDFMDISTAIGAKATAQLRAEVEGTWMTLAKGGADPIWLPNVGGKSINRVMSPSVLPYARYSKIPREVAFNLSRSTQDVAVGLTEAKKQVLQEAGTRTFVNNYIKPLSQPLSKVHSDIRRAIQNGGDTAYGVDLQSQIIDETRRHYVDWDPESYGLKEHFPTVEGDTIQIPRGVQRSLKYMGFTKDVNPLFSAYDRVMGVWRFAVLATPRHIAHVELGGLVMGALQDPLFLKEAKNAVSMMTSRSPEDRAIIRKFGGDINGYQPDQIIAYSTGVSAKRLLNEVTKGSDWLRKFEDNTTTMYKVAYMLRRQSKGVERDAAIKEAQKVFVSTNEMSPFERQWFTKIFPFYGFTRHLFRYLMTYPVDHPYRAAILTNLANQHQADWTSGLPQQMQFMFYLGAPDINGNVSAVDYRSIDPFRSFYNDFTLAGLVSDSNPALQFIAQQAGVNVLTATPELYPNKHYDPYSGSWVADRPKNFLLNALETAVPETQGVDALYGLSDQYRNLKISDPEAYQHRVYTTLGIPFGPETINIPAKVEAAQKKRYTDAQNLIDTAVQTGDFSAAKKYAMVPTPSLLKRYLSNVPYAAPDTIERLYRALQAQYGQSQGSGISLHALLPKS